MVGVRLCPGRRDFSHRLASTGSHGRLRGTILSRSDAGAENADAMRSANEVNE
jgi:hypothetical protein